MAAKYRNKRTFIAPRNLGENAVPRQDHMLLLLPPAKERARTSPAVDVVLSNNLGKPKTGQRVTRGPTVHDPNATKWQNMNTSHHMQTMMNLSGDLINRGDRGVMVDFYVEFAGEGGDGEIDKRQPWLFWPGGWHAKNGWWDDEGLDYSLEAVALRDEREAEQALKKEKDEALEEARKAAADAQSHYDALINSEQWATMSEDDQQHAAQVLLNSHRGVMPKRLHVALAALQADMGESKRKRLPPMGRYGVGDMGKWHGVKVNAKFRQVYSLALPYHRISGKLDYAIDQFFVNLKGLAELHLVGNRLSGCISSNINHVRSLRLVLLRNNRLKGPIPESMGELRSLVALDVSRNQLTGTIPSTFENLVNLQVLNVGDNQLQGPISCIDSLTNIQCLRYLNLEGNKFNGYVNSNFGDMIRLRVLSLARNDLSGAVPKSLGLLTELVSIDLSRNRFSGGLPFRPALQPSLHQMKFYGNDDLVGPDQWLRSETLRFQMERESLSKNNTLASSSSSLTRNSNSRGRAQVVDARVAAPFRDVDEVYSDVTNGKKVITARETLKSLRNNSDKALWQSKSHDFPNSFNISARNGSGTGTFVPTVANQTFARSDALATSTWSNVSRGNASKDFVGFELSDDGNEFSEQWPLCELSDESLLMEELKRLELPMEPDVDPQQQQHQRRWG